MADNENVEKNESPKKSIFKSKTLLIVLPILLFQIVLSIFLMNKVVKPKLLYSGAPPEIEKNDKENLGEIYIVSDVIVNPRETAGRRYVNVSVGLECKNGTIVSKLEKNDVKVRDYLITLFSNCTVDELDDAEDKEILRNKIKNDVNQIISENGVQSVYFTNFVLQ